MIPISFDWEPIGSAYSEKKAPFYISKCFPNCSWWRYVRAAYVILEQNSTYAWAMSTRQGEVSLRVGYTFFVKETTRMLVDIPGTLSPFQNASLTVVGGDTTERLTLYLNKTQLTLVLVCQRAFSLSLCQRDNENARWHTRHLEPCQRDKEKSLWGWDIYILL